MPNPRPIQTPDFSLGLMTKRRASDLPLGACQAGSKNFWLYGKRLSTAPGLTRLVKTLPDGWSYRLNGNNQFWRGFVSGTGSPLSLATTDFSIQLVFRLDRLPTQFSSGLAGAEDQYRGTLIHRGTGYEYGFGNAFGNTCYEIRISPDDPSSTGTFAPRVVLTSFDGVGGTNWVHSLNIELGVYYGVTVTFDSALISPNQWRFYVQELGTAATVDDPGSASTGIQDLSGADVTVGMVPVSAALSDGPRPLSKMYQYGFAGVIQELRFWDKALSATEINTTYPLSRQLTAAEVSSLTNLTAYYPLTGSLTDGYFAADEKAAAVPLRLYNREATWRDSGHTLGSPMLGNASVDLDGETQGFLIPRSFIYRKLQPNENGRYLFANHFSVTARLRMRQQRDRATIFHYCHVPNSASWNSHRLVETNGVGTFNCSGSVVGNVLLETITAPTRVTGEALTIIGANIDDTILNVPIVPQSLVVSLTHAGGACVMQDNGSGTLVFVSGVTSAITTATIDYATGALLINLADNIAGLPTATYEHTATTSFQFRGVIFHGKRVVSESLTATIAAGNVVGPLANSGIVPGSVRFTLTVTGVTGDVIVVDDGAGGFTKLKGGGTLDAGAISYALGTLTTALSFSANITAATVEYETYKATSLVSNIVGGALANTDYTVTFGVDSSAYATTGIVLKMDVNDLTETTVTSTSTSRIPSTGDFPEGCSTKYVATIGRSINRTRRSLSRLDDPDGVEVEYQNTTAEKRFFDGEIKQFVIAKSETAFEFRQLHQIVASKVIKREDVSTFGVPFTSVWNFEEGKGEFVEDIGSAQNGLSFQEDPDHVWGKSGVATIDKTPYLGGVDHRYRSATGEVKKAIIVGGGSVYEVTPSTGAVAWLADGFRNDDLEIPRFLKYQDSTIITATGSNPSFVLWKDQLYRNSIQPWKGIVPWGLDGQTDPDAGLRRGVRQICFTFRAGPQNKRSAPFGFFEFEIKARKANLILGEDAEINQTYPTSEASIRKGPFDVSSSFTKVGCSGWIGRTTTLSASDPGYYETNPGTSGAGTNAAPLKRINLNKSPFIDDKDSMEAEEMVTVFELQTKRVFVEDRANNKVEVKGAFPGSLGRLWLEDSTSAVGTVRTGGIFDFGCESSGTAFSGTGVAGGASGHGLTLPISDDPQVTELEIWGTTQGGSQFFLLDRVPNGTRSYIHRWGDPQLGGREVLNTNAGAAPKATHVLDFAGRALYFGNSLAKHRLYISETDQPWNVPPGSFIDFNVGQSFGITGLARINNVLLVFKSDSRFVVRETGNPTEPFLIEPRDRKYLGCVSPDAIIDKSGVFSYPSRDNFYADDTRQALPISDEIDVTWTAIRPSQHSKVFGVYDFEHDARIWLIPSASTSVNGSVVCDQALVQFAEGGWSLLDGFYYRSAARMLADNDVEQLWFFSPHGYVDRWNTGTNYGVGTLTSRTPALAAGTFSTTQVTVAQATLASLPEGYKGLSVTVIKASTGERATRLCIDDTLASPSVLTLDHALPFTPANTSDFSVVIGSIECDFISGEHSFGGFSKMTTLTDAHMQLTPQGTSATFDFLVKASGGINPTAILEGSRSISNQRNEILAGLLSVAASHAGRRQRYRFRSLGADKPFEARNLSLYLSSDLDSDGEYREDE